MSRLDLLMARDILDMLLSRWKMVVFSSTTFETGYVPDFPAQRKQIRSDLGPRVSFSQLMFRGIAIFHSLKSRNY